MFIKDKIKIDLRGMSDFVRGPQESRRRSIRGKEQSMLLA